MNLHQHPLSAAFPAMSDDDLQALTDDIEVNGQREPIVIFEDAVIDGWHRYQACTSLGIAPAQIELPDDEDPVAYVKSRNLHRRHLNASQRAAAIVACSNWQPRGRPAKSAPGAGFVTTEQMAREADVGKRTIERAKAAHAAGKGQDVRDGKVSLKEAAGEKAAPRADYSKPSEGRVINPALGADQGDQEFDPVAELERVVKELSAAHELIDTLSTDDTKTEIVKLKRQLYQVEEARDAAMCRAAEAQQRERETMNWLRRCGKAVGEEAPHKIPKAVETMASAARAMS